MLDYLARNLCAYKYLSRSTEASTEFGLFSAMVSLLMQTGATLCKHSRTGSAAPFILTFL